ncbi:MAG: prephenate dehydratase [Solirubrobacterales bacterium]
MKVSFLGPEGTFSEEALLANAEAGAIEPLPMPTIYDCVIAVRNATAQRALVPIENSLEGSVNSTLDALVFETDNVRIVGELVHPIRHCLIAKRPVELSQIARVVSHPQATAQCARFLREQLSGVEVVSASSTADAVRVVAESEQPWAALGNALSAEIYGCQVLRDRVEDAAGNETRFVWLSLDEPRRPSDPGSKGFWKTSIVFWGLPDKPGALVEALKEFADRGVNLSKIESRPRKQGLGRYVFFADLEGAESDDAIVDALSAVRGSVETLRILGCYPAA